MLKRLIAKRASRQLPLFKLLAVAEIALMARKHFGNLSPADRGRLADLVRRGRNLTPQERAELRALTAKLDAKAFALAAADKLSPVPVPGADKRRAGHH